MISVPVDVTTVVTTVASSAFVGLAVACGKLWYGVQANTAEIVNLKSDITTLKVSAAAQGAELRTVSDALASISTDLRWIKEQLASMQHRESR
jgi:septal ring factor EnvC (AmiA/AmiB activator)